MFKSKSSKQAKQAFESFAGMMAKQLSSGKEFGLGQVVLGHIFGAQPTAVMGWALTARRAGVGAALGAIVGGMLLGPKGAAIFGGIGGAIGGYSGVQKAARVWG